jgi:hypothetical protein
MSEYTPETSPVDFGDFLAQQIGALQFQLDGDAQFALAAPQGSMLSNEPSTASLRRRRLRRRDSGVHTATMVDTDGILRWEFGPGVPPRRMRRAMRAGPHAAGFVQPDVSRRVVQRMKFNDLPPNRVAQVLMQADGWLTPAQGLRQVGSDLSLGSSEATPLSEKSVRILLFVHGTFSSNQNTLEELSATKEGTDFLKWAVSKSYYQQVLSFNHPTLSVSALLNAADLARSLRDSGAQVDIVCHSRGGLVSRWWRESFDHGVRPLGRTIFVGSPLAGTGLAAPHNLKRALDLLSNFARAMHLATVATGAVFPVAAPLTKAVGLLVSLVGNVLRAFTGTPLLDAAISLLPGLATQARQGLNAEILGLRSGYDALMARTPASFAGYHFISSNFEPTEPGWKFWQYFRDAKMRAFDAGADAIFEGPNDLVVDTPSMDNLSDMAIPVDDEQRLDFGTNDRVHHTNYFQQVDTANYLRRVLGPG